MKAAVYLRVSSKDGRQDEANQEPDCLRLCAARGWEAVIFRERESGAKERPVWRSVLEAARLGKVQAVVFWAISRVGRNRAQVTHDIEAIYRWGAAVASVREGWLEQPMGPLRDLLLQFMAWTAQGEREELIERTRAGLARARAQGKRLGRPPADAVKLHEAVRRVLDHGQTLAFASNAAGLSRATVRRACVAERSARALAKKGGVGALS